MEFVLSPFDFCTMTDSISLHGCHNALEPVELLCKRLFGCRISLSFLTYQTLETYLLYLCTLLKFPSTHKDASFYLTTYAAKPQDARFLPQNRVQKSYQRSFGRDGNLRSHPCYESDRWQERHWVKSRQGHGMRLHQTVNAGIVFQARWWRPLVLLNVTTSRQGRRQGVVQRQSAVTSIHLSGGIGSRLTQAPEWISDIRCRFWH
mmetsp:Transcript_20669/g.39282  ORF Transcript_20669/g.39282 Transcript_20669/m.39282 type:complete len:205 (-) Transcript_20669:1167-1781(-)